MELLTVRETAEVLKVTRVTVRRYIASGRLAAVRVGRGLWVRKEEVAAMVKRKRMRSPDARPEWRSWSGRPTRADDPLWNIIGIASDDDGPTDVSSNKHKYLAEAYMPKSRISEAAKE